MLCELYSRWSYSGLDASDSNSVRKDVRLSQFYGSRGRSLWLTRGLNAWERQSSGAFNLPDCLHKLCFSHCKVCNNDTSFSLNISNSFLRLLSQLLTLPAMQWQCLETFMNTQSPFRVLIRLIRDLSNLCNVPLLHPLLCRSPHEFSPLATPPFHPIPWNCYHSVDYKIQIWSYTSFPFCMKLQHMVLSCL